MANYKKLTDVEVMEKVSEGTMALVEDNGALKRIPYGKINKEPIVIYADYDIDLDEWIYYSETDYEEVYRKITNHEIFDIEIIDIASNYYNMDKVLSKSVDYYTGTIYMACPWMTLYWN